MTVARGRLRFAHWWRSGLRCASLVGCVVWAALVAPDDHLKGLSVVLALAAVAAGLGVARVRQRVEVSASFLVFMLAAAFLGPASAFVAAVISEVAATRVIRTRRHAFLNNLVAAGLTALLAGTLIRDLAPHGHTVGFYLVLAGLVLGVFVAELDDHCPAQHRPRRLQPGAGALARSSSIFPAR